MTDAEAFCIPEMPILDAEAYKFQKFNYGWLIVGARRPGKCRPDLSNEN